MHQCPSGVSGSGDEMLNYLCVAQWLDDDWRRLCFICMAINTSETYIWQCVYEHALWKKCPGAPLQEKQPSSHSEKVCRQRDVTAVPEFRWGEEEGPSGRKTSALPQFSEINRLSCCCCSQTATLVDLTVHELCLEGVYKSRAARKHNFIPQLLVRKTNFLVLLRYVCRFPVSRSVAFVYLRLGRLLVWKSHLLTRWPTP